MKNILVDSSVWIQYFRNGTDPFSVHLHQLIQQNRVILTGVTEMEIYNGLREKELNEIQSIFDLLQFAETTRNDFKTAGKVITELRKNGKTIALSDALIASVCINNDYELMTLDHDFDYIPNLAIHKN